MRSKKSIFIPKYETLFLRTVLLEKDPCVCDRNEMCLVQPPNALFWCYCRWCLVLAWSLVHRKLSIQNWDRINNLTWSEKESGCEVWTFGKDWCKNSLLYISSAISNRTNIIVFKAFRENKDLLMRHISVYFTVIHYLLYTSNSRHKLGYLLVPGQYRNASAENGHCVLLMIMKLHFTSFYASSRGKKQICFAAVFQILLYMGKSNSLGSVRNYLMGDWGKLQAWHQSFDFYYN